MKKLQINNIAIQFSCSENENDMDAAMEIIDSINAILRKGTDVKIIVSDMFSPVDIDEID